LPALPPFAEAPPAPLFPPIPLSAEAPALPPVAAVPQLLSSSQLESEPHAAIEKTAPVPTSAESATKEAIRMNQALLTSSLAQNRPRIDIPAARPPSAGTTFQEGRDVAGDFSSGHKKKAATVAAPKTPAPTKPIVEIVELLSACIVRVLRSCTPAPTSAAAVRPLDGSAP
jgi:hypothetical protein